MRPKAAQILDFLQNKLHDQRNSSNMAFSCILCNVLLLLQHTYPPSLHLLHLSLPLCPVLLTPPNTPNHLLHYSEAPLQHRSFSVIPWISPSTPLISAILCLLDQALCQKAGIWGLIVWPLIKSFSHWRIRPLH